MPNPIPNQKIRLVILLVYIILLFVFNFFAFNQWLPSVGANGLWFYAGFISLLLGNLLVTPYYTKPVDALSYSLFAGIAIYLTNDWANWGATDKVFYSLVLIYFLVIAICAFVSIFLKTKAKNIYLNISNSLRIISDELGNQKAIFGSLILYSIVTFHRGSAKETFWITIAWALMVLIRPDEKILTLIEKVKKFWVAKKNINIIGKIRAHQVPNIVLIKMEEGQTLKFGQKLLLNDACADNKAGIVLDFVGREEGLLMRALECDIPHGLKNKIETILKFVPENYVAKFDDEQDQIQFIDGDIKNFSGIVFPESSIEKLYVEVIQDHSVETGRLFQVKVKDKNVIYQITDGLTKEEIVQQKNTFGYARASAKKIGIWETAEKKFVN